MGMRVWIDHNECTGDGLCEDVCATAFTVGDDGVAYVREDAKYFGETRVFGADGADSPTHARVPDDWADAAIEAADTCPGECIFVETD
jgi:ferredoxin